MLVLVGFARVRAFSFEDFTDLGAIAHELCRFLYEPRSFFVLGSHSEPAHMAYSHLNGWHGRHVQHFFRRPRRCRVWVFMQKLSSTFRLLLIELHCKSEMLPSGRYLFGNNLSRSSIFVDVLEYAEGSARRGSYEHERLARFH